MLQNLTGWHAILILVVVLLVFGASKLPALAKSVGQSVKILKDEVADDRRDGTAQSADATAAPSQTAPAVVVATASAPATAATYEERATS
ncbi:MULTISPECIES: twin-arginine translocase TatA/TatE family subunit [Demequina]|uniref:Sec-independent protein translocase protein TatA n=1 Tax=Demequina litorisediminis TaxID=1849022 RepID=A0ABQ6IAV6_9MICO|nr:twin-arginine translocase TatA/TatE family subunit [Demequina litorisediminis]GMA34485.1 hypothetical protein GCM10025876_06890 [Demequina litorisediminis]